MKRLKETFLFRTKTCVSIDTNGVVFLNIGLTQTCIAIAVPHPHGHLTKAPRGRQGHATLIVRNKVVECLTLLKIRVIGLQNGLNCILRDIDFEKKSGGGPPDPIHGEGF